MSERNVIIDTDVLIWYLKGKEDIAHEINNLIKNGDLFTTPITVTEIYAGPRPGEEAIKENIFNRMKVIEINLEIGIETGRFLNEYRKSYDLELAGAMIGASALFYDMQLWTMNKKHYPMLEKQQFV